MVRELRRLSRRRTTWVARVAAGAMGLTVILAILADIGQVDAGRLSAVGRDLFTAYVMGQLLFVGLLAPLQAAMAVEEERLDRALDMLVLTPMSRGALLWGKVASRLVHLMAVIIGGLPILGLITTFGGVDPWNVVNLTVNTAVMAVLLAQVATILVIAQRGSPLLAAVGAWGWGGAVSFVSMSSMVWDDQAWLPPPAAAFHDSAWGLLPAVVFAPVMLGLGWLGPLLFRLATGESEDDELGLLSAEVWTLHRFRRRTVWVLPIASFLGLIVAWGLARMGWVRGDAPFLPLPLLWTWTACFTGITVLEQGSGRAVTMAAQARKAVAQRRTFREESRTVVGPPLLWRLFATRVAAAVRPLLLGASGLWLLGSSYFLLVEGGVDSWVGPGIAAWCMSVGLAGLFPLATTRVDGDARRRQLLVLAGVTPWSLVTSHVIHAVVRVAPWIALGTVLVAYGLWGRSPGGPWTSSGTLLTAFTVLTLSSSTLLASLSTLVGFVAPRRTVWLVGIGLGLVVVFLPTVLSETFRLWRADDWYVHLLRWWSPLSVDPNGAAELPLLKSSLAYGVVSLLCVGAATRWVARRHR